MPPVTLLSPYSGRPVVVREQDLGRAIRDEAGRIFYVVEDAEHGRYASMTRKGSAKDLERYRALQAGTAPAMNGGGAAASHASAGSHAQPHDATGIKRRNPVGIALLVLVGVVIGAGAYVFVMHPEWVGMGRDDNTAPPQDPPTTPPTTPTPVTPGPTSERRPASIVVPVTFVEIDDEVEPSGMGVEVEAGPETGKSAPRDGETESSGDDTSNEQAGPVVSDAPAVLPDSPEDYADRLSEAGAEAAEPDADPVPVIVPNRTWRPERRPVVLSERDPDDRPYSAFTHTASGLRYLVTHRTEGPRAKAGSYVTVRYTAQTLDGKPLIDDASQSFVLMAGQAIRAFDEGLAGIREGEQLRLMVPRGHSSDGVLPGIKRVPDQPFLLDVQLVAVKPGVTHVVEKPGEVDAEPAAPGDLLTFHYVARVEGNDEVIDSTALHGQPMRLTLGKGEVIPGLELGIAGMRPGETRLLTIPPYLAYGEKGAGGGLIPPDAVLSFRITLLRADRPGEGE